MAVNNEIKCTIFICNSIVHFALLKGFDVSILLTTFK